MNEKIEAVLTAAIIVVGYSGVEAGIRQIWAPGAQRKQEFVGKELNKMRDPEGVKKNRLWSDFGIGEGRARQAFTSDIDYDKTRDFYGE